VVVVTMALATALGAGLVLVTGTIAHLKIRGRLLMATLLRRVLLNVVTTANAVLQLLDILELRPILDTLLLSALASRQKLALVSSFLLLTTGTDPEAPLEFLLKVWACICNLGVVAIGIILEGATEDTLVDPEDCETHVEG
jgi:hypothetical protein